MNELTIICDDGTVLNCIKKEQSKTTVSTPVGGLGIFDDEYPSEETIYFSLNQGSEYPFGEKKEFHHVEALFGDTKTIYSDVVFMSEEANVFSFTGRPIRD